MRDPLPLSSQSLIPLQPSHAAALVMLIIVLLMSQQLLFVPGYSLIRQTLHNSLHVPWFCIVTLVLLRLFSRWQLAVTLAMILAIASELLQRLTGRDPSISDVLRNLLGSLLALSLWASQSGNERATAARLLAAVLLLIACAPLGWKLLALAYNTQNFPVLLEGTHRLSRALVRTDAPVLQASTDDVGLTLLLDDKPWQGLHVTDPVGDWQRFTTLVCECSVDPGPPIDVFVGLLLIPGHGINNFALNQIDSRSRITRWTLSEILSEGDSVHDLFVYTTGEYAGRTLTIKRLWLEGDPDPPGAIQ